MGGQSNKGHKGPRVVAAIEGSNIEEDNPMDPPDTAIKIDELTVMLNSLQQEMTKLMKGSTTFTASTSTQAGYDSKSYLIDFAGKSHSLKTCTVKLYSDTSWILDTSATDHMSSNKSLFTSFEQLQKCIPVSFPDATSMQVSHSGYVSLFSIKPIHFLYSILLTSK